MRNSGIMELSEFASANGNLYPIELEKEIPFWVKRTYCLTNVPPEAIRGGHAHLIEKEVFICISGSVICKMDTDGQGLKKYVLDSPKKALFVNKKVWHQFENFGSNAVLLAFSSTEYLPGPSNYLHDYKAFCSLFK